MEDQVQHEPRNDGIDELETMQKNESSNESGYSGQTYEDVRRLIR